MANITYNLWFKETIDKGMFRIRSSQIQEPYPNPALVENRLDLF